MIYKPACEGDFFSCVLLNPVMELSSAPRSVPLEPFTAGGVTGDVSPGGAATRGKIGENRQNAYILGT